LNIQKNAVSNSEASSTVGSTVLFEYKAFTIDCSLILRTEFFIKDVTTKISVDKHRDCLRLFFLLSVTLLFE